MKIVVYVPRAEPSAAKQEAHETRIREKLKLSHADGLLVLYNSKFSSVEVLPV